MSENDTNGLDYQADMLQEILDAQGIPKEDFDALELDTEAIDELMLKPNGPCSGCGGPHPDGMHSYWASKWGDHQLGKTESEDAPIIVQETELKTLEP